MASTLETSYSDIRTRVGDFLGLGRTASAWSTENSSRVDGYIESGYRLFLSPGLLGRSFVHEWSFMHPMDSFATVITTALTGTLTFTEDSTAVTGSGTAFTTELDVGDTVKLDADGTYYTVSSITSDTALVLRDAYTGTTGAGAGSSGPEYRYVQDADFGGIEGKMTYTPGDGYRELIQRGEGQIRAMRQQSSTPASGRPTHYAIRWKEATGESTQLAEILLWPVPDAVYTLNFPKLVMVNALSATYTTPLGGMFHSETVLELCLRAAELGMDDEEGVHHRAAARLLAASIAHDRRMGSPRNLGYNSDRSDYVTASRIVDPVTVGGVEP